MIKPRILVTSAAGRTVSATVLRSGRIYISIGIGTSIIIKRSFSVSASVGWANMPSRIAV